MAIIQDFARQYHDNPYVWIDIHNEPGTCEGLDSDFSQYRAAVIAMVDAIREL